MTGDPKQYTANIYNWLKTKFTNTATDSKMDGTQSAGTSNLMARADHVHPTDTSRASSDHVHGSITNDGKVGSAANKPLITGTAGLVGAGAFEDTSSNIKMDGTAGGGSLNTFARGDHVHPTDTSRAPENHASSSNTYGVGSASNYGHVKVDAAPTSSSTNAVASGGVDSALALKQNEVETQSKVVKFTNKDRINIERMWDYINSSDSNYYKLDLVIRDGSPYHDKVPTETNIGVMVACTVYKGKNSPTPQGDINWTLKYTDNTVITTGTSEATTTPTIWETVTTPSTPGIYYVYAEANIGGSVVKSNIISVFVKDTNNILSYDLWSAGEYSNTVELLPKTNNIIPISTSEASINGEKSIRTISKDSALNYIYYDIPQTITDDTVVTAKVKVYNPNTILDMRLLNNNNIYDYVLVNIDKANCFKEYTVFYNASSGAEVRLLFVTKSTGLFYIDDINVFMS